MEGDTTVVGATLLGPVQASRGGQIIDLGPPRLRTVFAVLATNTNRVVSREELVDAVWGVDAPATAINSVYTYVARLRGKLEPTRPLRAQGELLASDGVGYMLRLSAGDVDKDCFETHLRRARQCRGTNAAITASSELEFALNLWRGTAYGGAVGPFVEAERTRLTELRLTATEDRAELAYELGRLTDLVGELSGLVSAHPLRERLRYLLMLCYAQLGRRAEALRLYHDVRAHLLQEQGIEPGEQLQTLYEDLLRIRARQATVPAQPAPRPDPPAAGRIVLAQLARDVPDFTGRAGELRELRELTSTVGNGNAGGVILLSGAPGVGKTAVAVHCAHRLADRFPDGQLHIDLRGANGPLAATEVLRHLLATLGTPGPLPDDPEQLCTQYRSMVAGLRLLILLDNAESVHQVRPLLPGASSCLVIVTSRNRLAGLTVRDGARRFVLDAMDEDDAVELFTRVAGRSVATWGQPDVAKLVECCGRLPLAVRVAATRVALAPSPERALALLGNCEEELLDRLEVPGDEHSSVSAVFGWSYRALSEDAARMFRAIGRHSGPDFTLAMAAGLAGVDLARCRRMIDALLDANLLQEPVHDHFRLNALIFAYARRLGSTPEQLFGQVTVVPDAG
ncbi:AfsR/SARP family transcriptional regulator [Actinokineospora sp.]|uniref:AfsR/SARP family transcriptional regulator n=1 Tax=Actinokineospora sp. TaxID=1872133 RepID=UPI004037DA43